MAKLDISKLKFTPAVERGGKIEFKVPGMNKLYPITKEQFLVAVEKGYHLDKLHVVFTKESIAEAQKEVSSKTKKEKDASEN